MSVSVTVVVPAAQEAAWERWTDVARWPEWNPPCIAAALDGPLAPGTALHLEIYSAGAKIGALEVGRGSLYWTGRSRHRSKRISWTRFAEMMDSLAYGS